MFTTVDTHTNIFIIFVDHCSFFRHFFFRLRRDKPPPPPPHLPPVPEGEPQHAMPPQQTQFRPSPNQGPHSGPYNGGMHPGMRPPLLPGQSPQMMPHQGMGYSPRSPMAAQHIPMGPGSNRSAGGSSVESYPPPLQRPGPNAGMGPPHASVRMVSHPNNNPHLQQQHHPGMHPGMRMQQPPPGGHPGIRRPSSSTSDMYNHQQHPQMMQPQRSASTIPFPSPSTSQGA